MSKFSKLKKTFTGLVSTAVISASMTAVTAVPTVSASSDPNYAEALALSLYFFDANACGSGITDGPLTWRGDCHTYDSQASLDSSVGLSASEKEAVKNANGGSSIIDASGGYHDAGDHIKFSMTMGFATTSLAWSYFSYPDAFETAQCTDHLKYILKNACDYFMKVTFLDENDNVIAYVDQIASEGEDHSIWTAPETQNMNRTVYWASPTTPIADSAGQMASALASSSLAFKDSDPAYSAECLKYAFALQEFASKYPSYNATGRGGMYNGGESLKDDIVWAKLWCDLAENGGTLPDGYTPPATLTGDKAYSTGEYDGWLYCWGKVYSGYAGLLGELGYDGSKYKNEAGLEVRGSGGSSFSTSSYCSNWGWGSARYNCALQGIAWRSGDSTLEDSAKHQMDCILDSSTAFKSYLVGYGDSYPLHYHHRASNPGTGNPADNTSADHVLYGALLGGPDSSGSYDDSQNSYGCTEPALDYNGCFVLAIAPLVSKYGGDASETQAVIASAEEINENFVFDDSDPDKPKVTQTTGSTTKRTTTTTTTVATVKRTEPISVSSNSIDVEIQLNGAKAVEYTLKGNAGTNVNGGLDGTDKSGQYKQVAYNGSIGNDGKLTGTLSLGTINADKMTFHLWWPNDKSVTIDSLSLVYYDVVDTPATETTTTVTAPYGVLYGDANVDGNVDISDAVLILQSLANPDKYQLSAQGKSFADVSNNGDGVTAGDALVIQQVEAGVYKQSELPVSFAK